MHNKAMPKFGGPAIIIGFLVSSIYLLITSSIEGNINIFGPENYIGKLLGFLGGILMLSTFCFFDDIKGIEFSSFPDGVVIEVAKAIAVSWPINLMELIDLIESFGYLPFIEMHADYIVIENLKELKA